MDAPSRPRRLARLVPLLLAASLPGCGEAPVPTPSAEDGWSSGGASAAATEADQAALTARVLGHLDGGATLGTPAWRGDVDALAELLWPATLEGAAPPAVAAHVQALTIAADVARRLRTHGAPEREALGQDAPLDLAMHDDGRRALEAGPAAWRAWVEREGQELLAQKQAWLRRQFEGR